MSHTLNNDVLASLNREFFMVASEEFLNSLSHGNPQRPHFAIGMGTDAQLTISHRGQVMRLPISEVLNFAQRWNADQDHQWETGKKGAHLRIFPYPLYGIGTADSDVVGMGWDAL